MKRGTVEEICARCVDKQEVLVDEHGKFLKLVSTTKIEYDESLNKEVLKKFHLCQDVFKLNIKQLIILNEPRVRFLPANDIAGLQQQIEDTQLSSELKKFMRDVSKVGYSCLQKEGCFEDLVELDAERQAIMNVFDEDHHITGYFDMFCLMNNEGKERQQDENKEEVKSILSQFTSFDMDDRLSEGDNESLKSHCIDKSIYTHRSSGHDSLRSSKQSLSSIDNLNVDKINPLLDRVTANQEMTVVTFLFTPRNFVCAREIFKQLLFYNLCCLTHVYCVVCHAGPLVENQVLSLYKYTVADDIIKLCTETKLNVETLENVWRDLSNKHIHTLADVKDYFRYLVYDCPGIIDIEQEKKDKYERREKRRMERREIKEKKKLARKQEKKLESVKVKPLTSRDQFLLEYNSATSY